LLGEQASAITRFLDYIADKEEWAVKIFLDRPRAETWQREADPHLKEQGRDAPASPGVRYFQEKRLRTEAQRRVKLWSREIVGRIHEALVAQAVDACPLRLQAPSGSTLEMVWHGGFLLHRDQVESFRACAARLDADHANQGLTLETSGPWPPFTFSPSPETGSRMRDEVPGLLHTP
jgi:hypothetical protein